MALSVSRKNSKTRSRRIKSVQNYVSGFLVSTNWFAQVFEASLSSETGNISV